MRRNKTGCVRCQNLGRECGGYAPEALDDSSKNVAPVPIHPRPMSVHVVCSLVAIPGTQEERRYFQLFCDKTAAEICGSFDPSFWTEKVLQLCHSDAPIRHATIALGALQNLSIHLFSDPAISFGISPDRSLIWMNITDTLCGNTAEPSLPFDKFFPMDGAI